MMMFSRAIELFQDFRDHAGAHGAAALADREPQLLLHRDRRDQLDRHLRVVARHHHLHPRWQLEDRSEEHTSELQSRLHLVCRLLLEKKKKKIKYADY